MWHYEQLSRYKLDLFCDFILTLCKEHLLWFGGTEVFEFCHRWILRRTCPRQSGRFGGMSVSEALRAKSGRWHYTQNSTNRIEWGIVEPSDQTVTNEQEERTQFCSPASLGKMKCHVVVVGPRRNCSRDLIRMNVPRRHTPVIPKKGLPRCLDDDGERLCPLDCPL